MFPVYPNLIDAGQLDAILHMGNSEPHVFIAQIYSILKGLRYTLVGQLVESFKNAQSDLGLLEQYFEMFFESFWLDVQYKKIWYEIEKNREHPDYNDIDFTEDLEDLKSIKMHGALATPFFYYFIHESTELKTHEGIFEKRNFKFAHDALVDIIPLYMSKTDRVQNLSSTKLEKELDKYNELDVRFTALLSDVSRTIKQKKVEDQKPWKTIKKLAKVGIAITWKKASKFLKSILLMATPTHEMIKFWQEHRKNFVFARSSMENTLGEIFAIRLEQDILANFPQAPQNPSIEGLSDIEARLMDLLSSDKNNRKLFASKPQKGKIEVDENFLKVCTFPKLWLTNLC